MTVRAADLQARQAFRTISGRLGVVIWKHSRGIMVYLTQPPEEKLLHWDVLVIPGRAHSMQGYSLAIKAILDGLGQ